MQIPNLKAHYKKLFDLHGPNHNAVQQSSAETQFARFENLVKHLPETDSIADVGCGLGDLAWFVKNVRKQNRGYLGLDFVEEFITNGKLKDDANVSYKLLDVQSEDLPKGYDWYVASGIFNNKIDNNWDYLVKISKKMFEASTKGIAFNLLSTYVDYQDSHLHYFNPNQVFDHFKLNVSKKVLLDHSYEVKPGVIPFEYTVVVCK
jgi:cyclopropane fatty-acyl-phospholipid synthase-like methyltransferase